MSAKTCRCLVVAKGRVRLTVAECTVIAHGLHCRTRLRGLAIVLNVYSAVIQNVHRASVVTAEADTIVGEVAECTITYIVVAIVIHNYTSCCCVRTRRNIPCAGGVEVPVVATAIGHIDFRAGLIELGRSIAGIDAPYPTVVGPVHWTVEIRCCYIGVVLPGRENALELLVTERPIIAVEVIVVVDCHEVVEVDLIGSLILLIGEVQLVSHLVGKEQCLILSLTVCHCGSGGDYCHHHCYQHHLY